MIAIGIDPGVSGGIAFIGETTASVHDLPTLALPAVGKGGKSFVPRRIDGRALAVLIRENVPAGVPARAFCEGVRAMPVRDGRSTVQSEGSLMRTLGAIEAVLDVLQLSPTLVVPQAWQTFYGLVGKNNEMRARGELPAAVRKAIALYPALEPDLCRVKAHNRAEAILIGHFALRKLVATA